MNKKMMRQAQEFQQKMVKMQEELELATLETTSGGGAVKVEITGKMKLQTLEISPEVLAAGDIDMLQDLVLAAVNEAIEKAQDMASERMRSLTGGLNIPGLT